MSPYSYLAASQLEAVEQRTGAAFNWVPIFLPGLMKAVGNKGPLEVPFKAMYALKDVNDWAKHYALPELRLPDEFPFSCVNAQRAFVVAAELGKGPAFGLATYRMTWHEGRCPKNDDVVGEALSRVGLDPAAVLERARADAVKEKLRANTDAAVERGVFGAPTFFVGDEMFVEKALSR